MAGPEDVEWIARLERQLEPLRHSWQSIARAWQSFARDTELQRCETAANWRRLSEAWRELSSTFVAARERGDFRNFQIRLRLTGWMMQRMEEAKDNPSHQRARAWLEVQHLTPKEIAELLPYMFMDLPELHIPRRIGRPPRIAASTLEMAKQLDERIKRTGELPTTAAKRLLTSLGFCGQNVKGRADHLVRVWKSNVLKSR